MSALRESTTLHPVILHASTEPAPLLSQPLRSSGSLPLTSATREVTVSMDAGLRLGGLFSQFTASQARASAASIEADRATDARMAALEASVRAQSEVIAALQRTVLAQSEAQKAAKENYETRINDLQNKLSRFEHRFVHHFHGPFPQQHHGRGNHIRLTPDEVHSRRPNIAKWDHSYWDFNPDESYKIVYEIPKESPLPFIIMSPDVEEDYNRES